MKTIMTLMVCLMSFSCFAMLQKISVNGVIYRVDPMTRYPLAKKSNDTHDRSITPLVMKSAPTLFLL